MNAQVKIFRFDQYCFLISIPSRKESPFLRIGDSLDLSPHYHRQIGLILFTPMLTTNLDVEIENLLHGSVKKIEYIALPSTLHQWRKKLRKCEELELPITTIPAHINYRAKTGALQALFLKDDNVVLNYAGKEIFDLRGSLWGHPDKEKAALEKKKIFTNIELSRRLPFQNFLPQSLAEFYQMEKWEIEDQLRDEMNSSEIEIDLGRDSIILRQKDIFCKMEYFPFTFETDHWCDNVALAETDQSFEIEEMIQISIQNNTEEKMSLRGWVQEKKVLRKNARYQYRILFDPSTAKYEEFIDFYNRFRLYDSVLKFIKY